MRTSFIMSLLVCLGLGGCSATPGTPTVQPRASTRPPPPPTHLEPKNAPPTRVASGWEARPDNATCHAPDRPQHAAAIVLTPVFDRFRFREPVAMVRAPGDESSWYVLERSGRIFQIPTEERGEKRLVLDIRERVYSRPLETGLLGLAFHPNFPQVRSAFLSYTSRPQGTLLSHIDRVPVAANGLFDMSQREALLTLEQPGVNHNGGHITFGPDRLLYIAMGDGQLGADPDNRAQRLDNLFGKILRIDVDRGSPYGIPPDNPFVTREGARTEIYAFGLRNPWRFSFDRGTGELWLGDVGQADREEINRVVAGGNYGWSARQGTLCYIRRRGCDNSTFRDPIVEYTHAEGFSVTGGHVYRGARIPALRGQYVFGDFGSRRIWTVEYDPRTGKPHKRLLLRSTARVASFAEDASGEIYVVDYRPEGGRIHRIDPAPDSEPASNFPQRLSETGCVDPRDPSQPAEGVLPYTINHPFWSDGASKERRMAIPNATQVSVRSDGSWEFPIGSVLTKQFRRAGRLLETRLMVRHQDGFWAGYLYRWNQDQTDAMLLDEGLVARLADGSRWSFPSRAQCLQCHNAAASYVLGPENRQMNRDQTYPGNRIANQVDTLRHIGVLSSVATYEAPLLGAPTPGDPGPYARAYLHANCAFCHRPGGGARGELDLRISTPLEQTGTCNEAPGVPIEGLGGYVLLQPGHPERSLLWQRMTRRDAHGMPHIGSLRVDEQAVNHVGEWIRSQQACPEPAPR